MLARLHWHEHLNRTAKVRAHPPANHVLIFAALIWLALYQMLDPAAEALVGALPVDRASHLGGALQFFFTTRPRF